MKKKLFDKSGANDVNKTLRRLSHKKDTPKIIFLLLLALYIATSVALRKVASDHSMVFLLGARMPMQAFAGVYSSISNVCLILLAVLFGRVGFITSIVILMAQFPMLAAGMLARHNYTTIPGAFSNLLALVAVTVVYINHARVHKYQRRILTQAITDRLTGLPNRFACMELIESYVTRRVKFAVVSVDLNNFKGINDTMGHETGDKALIEIAKRWTDLIDARITDTNDFVARLSGDDFFIVISGYRTRGDIVNTISRFKSELERKITIDDCDYYMGAGFGYAEFPDDADSASSILACASAAMHEVKRRGGVNDIIHYMASHVHGGKTLEIERKIRSALDQNLVHFQLQPQYDMDKKLRGFEALARMRDSEGNLVSPLDFIPVAEELGLVDRVDVCVFKKAAKFIADIIKEKGAGLTLCVNVSVRHLMKNNFIDELRSVLAESGLAPNNLEIEITESIMIDSADKALACIKQVKAMGVKVAIDDFGTGYSSLSYLNKFPADMLKIDKSFIDVMNSSESSKQYVATIISIGHILNLKVISEGVETEDQLDTLRQIGCDYVQGYIWGRPLDPQDAAALV